MKKPNYDWRLNFYLNDFIQSHKKMINFWVLQVHAVVSILLYWESSLKTIKTNTNTCLENIRCTQNLVENTVCVHYISSALELVTSAFSGRLWLLHDCAQQCNAGGDEIKFFSLQWFMWMGECREYFLHCSVFRHHLPITGVSSYGLGESTGSSTCQHMWGPGFNPQGCVSASECKGRKLYFLLRVMILNTATVVP